MSAQVVGFVDLRQKPHCADSDKIVSLTFSEIRNNSFVCGECGKRFDLPRIITPTNEIARNQARIPFHSREE